MTNTGLTSIMIHADANTNEELRRIAFTYKTSKKKVAEKFLTAVLASGPNGVIQAMAEPVTSDGVNDAE